MENGAISKSCICLLSHAIFFTSMSEGRKLSMRSTQSLVQGARCVRSLKCKVVIP